MKPLRDCAYTAFISYAHADDQAWFNWVTQFRDELARSLPALLRGVPLPPFHLSGDNGPVAGQLSEELRERVADAFAMIIVVHDNYAQSSWCLRELEYFRTLFGEEGFRERLYIVALSEAAMLRVAGSEAWKRLLPSDDQLWMPFFDPLDKARPLDIYLGPGFVSPAFRQPFERLRSDFAARLKKSWAEPAAAAPVPAPPAPGASAAPPVADEAAPAAAPGSVRIYIESNRHERTLWEPLGERIRQQWDELCEALAPARRPPLALRAHGLPVDEIDRFPTLDDADGVVLLWGRKTSDALVAQINKVENKMPAGRSAAPGIVAYLMPPQEASEPVPAWGWQVLRFDARDEDAIDVVDDEEDQLRRFLRKVFERHARRTAVPPP